MTVESKALPDALDPLGVLVIRLGPDGTVLSCNETVVELLGIPASAILGRHHQTLFGSLDVPRAGVVERMLFRPDGGSTRIRWSINPEFDPSGMPNGMSCLGVEATKAEEPTISARTSGDGVFLIDGDGRIERMNRATAKLFGVDNHPPVDGVGAIPEVTGAGRGVVRQPEAPLHFDGPTPLKGVVGLANGAAAPAINLRIEPKAEAPLDQPTNWSDTTIIERIAQDEPHQARHLNALKEVLRATRMSSPIELTRSVLPRIADLVCAQAAAVTFEVDGQQFVEFFGLPPETAAMVVDLLSRSEFNLVPLRALTRMNVIACTALQGTRGRFGHVLLFSRRETELDEERLETLETLAKSFAVALENVLFSRQIDSARASRDSAHESILRALVAALELRDHETEGHTQRVTRISLQLAELLGLRGEDLRNLEHGALLHDVGKIGIPDAILHKPGPLSASEWEVMRKHPQYAYDILSPLPHLSHALDVPYCHHERFDGSGYPRGLEGSDIPLSARIFAVVDVYDAMTTERPYRPALPEDYAIAHLKSHAGTHFDPTVVAAFTELIEQSPIAETVPETVA